jgi:hypothetical protein
VGRIERGWTITTISWRVLGQDRELLWVPVLAGIAALLAFAAIAVPGAIVLGGLENVGTDDVASWLVGLAAATAAAWVFAIGQATLIAGAGQRFDGADPTIESAFAVARSRAGRLFGWAVLTTVVGTVLDQIEQRLGIFGRLLAIVGRSIFGILGYLALPVMVFEDTGAIESFKRSAGHLRSTWGEQLTFGIGIGLITMAAFLAGGMVAAVIAFIGLPFVALALMVVWTVVVVVVNTALSAVFKTALYRWVTKQSIDPAFDDALFQGAFRPRR